MSKSLSVALCLTTCLMSSAALAKYCVKLPSCEELGYIFPYKEGRRSIRCPFDTSKVLYLDYCQAYGLSAKPSDTAGAYQECVEEKADGTKINTGYYRYTRCNSGYTYLSGNCIYSCASNADYPLNSPSEYCKTPTDSKDFSGVTCYSSTCEECESGYDMDSSGTCWNCQADSSGIAYGLYLCGDGKIGNTQKTSKTCAEKTYYEECLVVETCFYTYRLDSSCPSGIKQSYLDSNNKYYESCDSKGYEINTSSASCVRQSDGKTYYQSERFCNINGATCADKKRCPNDEGATGTSACECGGYKYFSSCKDNCTYTYRLDSSCPSGIKQSYLDSNNKYYESCDSKGYEINTSSASCVRQSDGKTYYQSERFCNINGATCADKKRCPNDEGATGTSACTCGGYKYFSSCKDNCAYTYRPDSSCSSGIKQSYLDANNKYYESCDSKGYEINTSSASCTRSDGKTYYQSERSCNASGATCAGKKRCEYPDPSSLCSCGGYLYSDNCLTQCNYEDTPETCEAKGMGFSLKCLTEDTKYGECVKS